MSSAVRTKRAVRTVVDRALAQVGWRLVRIPQQGRPSYVPPDLDGSKSLPPGSEAVLRLDHPRLAELREAYDQVDWPVRVHSRWQTETMQKWIDVGSFRYFRGESMYVWHYRESPRTSRLKYFIFLNYIARRDARGLLRELGEDGAFGCWTFTYPGFPTCSRDLLDSLNELYFLDRHLDVFSRTGLRLIDIGAGYGRLAHRASSALSGLSDYCCVDAVPESTFLCEYYTQFRGVAPPARVVPLPEVPNLPPASFDLAINVHSFSECTLAATEWWMRELARLHVPWLFLVPNEAAGFLSLEADSSRIDYLPAIESAGYRLVAEERVFADDAVRELIEINDRFCLFQLQQ